MSALSLPRSLVLQLLHRAQQGASRGFVTRLEDGNFRISDAAGDAPFAFYRTASQARPEAGDVELCRGLTTLMLSASVGIKGVLELRAWRIVGEHTEPVELSLAEESEIPA